MEKKLSDVQKIALIETLKKRFLDNPSRHVGVEWSDVEAKLLSSFKLWSLSEMEKTGGEPDVVLFDENTNKIIFVDCASESPTGRRSLCYDQEALISRKTNKPVSSACAMALEMGVELLDERQYRALQQFGQFDLKTSSWVKTPTSIRDLGGALFCDRRYNQVFVYHNGADSYYGSRGFRSLLEI